MPDFVYRSDGVSSRRAAGPGGRLSAFGDALARRLPGDWTAVVDEDFAHSPACERVIEELWDDAHVQWAVDTFVHREAAFLIGPADEHLVVLARPHRPEQFLVAALAPPGTEGILRTAHPPHGIAVSHDSARAAAGVERRLLPRYRQSLASIRIPALRRAHRLAEQALDEWDAVSDSYCDEHGFPRDEHAYGLRQAQRDADAWRHFETFLFHGPAAIEHAQAAVAGCAPSPATADRWRYQLRALADALTAGARVRDDWESRLALLRNHQGDPDRKRAFDDAVDTRNAEGWSAVDGFIKHAPALLAINDTEHVNTSPGKARLAAARARSTTTAPVSGSGPPANGPSAPARCSPPAPNQPSR
jgi:hypothetical protein